jgi:hypothetical protein
MAVLSANMAFHQMFAVKKGSHLFAIYGVAIFTKFRRSGVLSVSLRSAFRGKRHS